MENKDLEWIANVIEKLNVPQTHNERQRLIKILVQVAPALIKVLDWTALSKFSVYFTNSNGKDELSRSGHTCNACGQDHHFDENNAKHCETGVKRDGTGGEACRYEELLQVLMELERKEDK